MSIYLLVLTLTEMHYGPMSPYNLDFVGRWQSEERSHLSVLILTAFLWCLPRLLLYRYQSWLSSNLGFLF